MNLFTQQTRVQTLYESSENMSFFARNVRACNLINHAYSFFENIAKNDKIMSNEKPKRTGPIHDQSSLRSCPHGQSSRTKQLKIKNKNIATERGHIPFHEQMDSLYTLTHCVDGATAPMLLGIQSLSALIQYEHSSASLSVINSPSLTSPHSISRSLSMIYSESLFVAQSVDSTVSPLRRSWHQTK